MNRAVKTIAVTAMLFALSLQGAQAQIYGNTTQDEIITPGCDANIFNIHTNRAILEASREVVINGSFINKPDSVLEYTCFGDVIVDSAAGISSIYAATDLWNPRNIPYSGGTVQVAFALAPDSFDTALQLYVLQSAGAYLDTAFWHTYLGGSDPVVDIPSSAPCTVMDGVWSAAKCRNFPDNYWLRFSEMLTVDPRAFPHTCDSGVGFTQATIDRSREANLPAANFAIAPEEYNTTYFLTASDCNHSAPVLTGVTTQMQYATGKTGQKVPYPDGFCISPGCNYTIPRNQQGQVSQGAVSCER